MSTKIRLSRAGTKKRPYYSVIVTNSRSPRDSKFIEKIGVYNPMLAKDNPERFKINEERVKYWLSVGAQTTERLEKFLDAAGLRKSTTDYAAKPKKTNKKAAKAEAAA